MDHGQMVHIPLPDGGMIMVMRGIPGWMLGAGAALVVLLSFVVVERRGLAAPSPWRWNLTRRPAVHRLVRRRWFQPLLQLPVLALFLLAVIAGLVGRQQGNIAPVLVWTIWWGALVFAVALLGNAWCTVCPWEALASLASRAGGIFRRKEAATLGLRAPEWLRTTWPALLLFVVLTWLELGWGVTTSARGTAYLGLGMAGAAIAGALLFERRVFCTSVCFVGRITGLYGQFAPIGIEPRDARVCGVCRSRACRVGAGEGHPCPTGIDLGRLDRPQDCTGCTECFKSCPTLAPAWRLRPPGQGLLNWRSARTDEAWLALVLLALTLFHGLSMTSVWEDLTPGALDVVDRIQRATGLGRLGSFTVGMAGFSLLPIALYLVATRAGWRLARRAVPYRDVFRAFAWSILPVALFYHLAHNAMHLGMEGQHIWPLLSDPFGWGWDLFGTAASHPGALLSQATVSYLQVGLVLTGHLFGVVISHRIARDLLPGPRLVTRAQLPILAMMVALSFAGLWLLHLDMNMRMGRM